MNQPTPKFRSNSENAQKLQEMSDILSKNEYYIMPSVGLRKNAIMDIIRRHMMERRRKNSDPLLNSIMEEATEEESDSSCSTTTTVSSKNNSSPVLVKYSPPYDRDEKCNKVTEYNAYFKEGIIII